MVLWSSHVRSCIGDIEVICQKHLARAIEAMRNAENEIASFQIESAHAKLGGDTYFGSKILVEEVRMTGKMIQGLHDNLKIMHPDEYK